MPKPLELADLEPARQMYLRFGNEVAAQLDREQAKAGGPEGNPARVQYLTAVYRLCDVGLQLIETLRPHLQAAQSAQEAVKEGLTPRVPRLR